MGVMVSVLDEKARKFVSEEQDFPIAQCSLATEKFEVISPIAPTTGDSTTSHVTGAWQQAGVALDLTFTKTGPLLANAGSGCFPPLGEVNFHFAFPTMNATGTITSTARPWRQQAPPGWTGSGAWRPGSSPPRRRSGSGSGSCSTTATG